MLSDHKSVHRVLLQATRIFVFLTFLSVQ